MNILGVSYNGNVQNTEQKSIRPLQNEGSKGALTGMKLSEGKRLDTWEITHVQSENSVSLANTYQPGGSIKVVHTEDRHYLRNTEQYFGVFEQYAKGQISEDELTAYSAAFRSEVKNTLNTDEWVGGINALVKEMKENISKGIANMPDNLKTEFSVDGMKFTWKELTDMYKTGAYIDKFLAAGGSGTYTTYSHIGIAKAYVHKSELGLTEKQVKFLSDAVEKKIDRKLESSRLIFELAAADRQNPMWEGYYIGGTNTQPVASNTKMISEIAEAFSKIDPNDKSTYDAAVDKFEDVMQSWETIFASYVARQAPGYAATHVQDKEYYSRKAFQAIWNGTY